MSVSLKHTAMLRKTLKESSANERPLKRRRKASPQVEVITISSSSSSELDLEDVDLGVAQSQSPTSNLTHRDLKARDVSIDAGSAANSDRLDADSDRPDADSDDFAADSDDFDDLEDVDLDKVFGLDQEPNSETLTFKINHEREEPKKQKKAKRSYLPIAKEERAQRLTVHKLMVLSMLCHGAIRNKWCSDPMLLKSLNKAVPQEVKTLLDQDDADVLDYVKSKRLIEALRKLLLVYSKKFRCTVPGLSRYDWGEAGSQSCLKAMTLEAFSRAVKSFQGSKDTGAQGFVAILRSVGVDARLVFSIQVPDYRSLKPAKVHDEPIVVEDEPQVSPRSEFDPVFIPDSRQDLLKRVRKKKETVSASVPKKPAFNFPVFWIEVWNKYSKKMISIDPIVFKIVEVVPMRRKCKFEAPGSELSHQSWYIIAFNPDGSLRDVTRRYTQFFNAKTAKKRIASHSDEDEHWYGRVLRAVGKKRSHITNADAMELKELYDRHICEGTPNNMADFKNHPVYALESQLRQDEVIYPNNESSKCGTFRSMNKKSVTTIYRRSHVCRLRTPKAWHMQGRVLKVGVQPLKVRKINVNSITEQEEEEDGEIRMYAEFQTELFIPPPIVDGKIVKNAYGNVEVFTPTMIPENGYLAKISKDTPLKLLEQAARTLDIDYAKAVVAFDFGAGSKSNRRSVTAKEGGILIGSEYKEAVLAVAEGLRDEEEEKKRERIEMNALRSWKFFLTKLRIIKRLDSQHGKVSEEPQEESGHARGVDPSEDEEGYYSVGSEEEGSENEGYVPRKSRLRRRLGPEESLGEFSLQDAIPDHGDLEGSFMAADMDGAAQAHHTAPEEDIHDDAMEGGGFFTDGTESFGVQGEQTFTGAKLPAASMADFSTGEHASQPDEAYNGEFGDVQIEERRLGIEYSDSE